MNRATIEAFLRHAERYCAWFETVPLARKGESERELCWREGRTARLLVAELYALGAKLEDAYEFTDEEDPDLGKVLVRHEPGSIALGDLVALRRRLSLLPFQYYTSPLEDGYELKFDGEFGTGDLCDDLFDIWQDLRRGLNAWSAGRRSDALFEWQLSFTTHLGPHAVDALKALHEFLRSSDYLDATE